MIKRKAKPIPAQRSHLHRCGDYDFCHRDNPLETDCKDCEREAFRKHIEEETAAMRLQDEMAGRADPISRYPEGQRP
jgi:hypothetical protein